jgi:hypothetical protein
MSIKQKGLKFFDGATKAWRLKPLSKHDKKEIRYSEWRPTPMPDRTFSSGWWPGFECADGLSKDWKKRIVKAARSPGSYYTHESGTLLVLPDLKIIILIYSD